VLLWYVQSRLKFDIEDRLGWSLVPFAMFLGIKMNAARHVLIVLLVPDKRGFRNIAAAAAMALQTALPGFIRFGALLSIVNVFLFLALLWYLDQVGWHTVRQEWRRPLRTIRSLLAASRGVDSPD
jgi:hypothetical protein